MHSEKSLRNLDICTLKLNIYEVPVLLNGLKADTVPLNTLLRYIDDMFLLCKPIKPSRASTELCSLLEKWCSNEPCQIKKVIEKIEDCRKFQLENRKIVMKSPTNEMVVPHIPHELNKLVQLLKELHYQNRIIL